MTRRRRPPWAAALLGGLVLVGATTACSPEELTSTGGGEPDDTGREIFEALEALPSCGEIEVGHDAPQDVLDDGWACLDAARDTGAQLTVTYWTDEGDPIVEHHRVGPGIAGLDTYVDATADQFGEQIWTYRSCPDTVTAAEPLGCWDSGLVEG